jgi:hypothetical protein
MQYKDIVNNVLRRLRENTVDTVNQTAYSTLVGMFINDAKEDIENAWSWSGHRTTLNLDFATGEDAKELDTSLDNFTVLHVFNDTQNYHMQQVDTKFLNQLKFSDSPQSAPPIYYAFNRMDSDGIEAYSSSNNATGAKRQEDGDSTINVYPIPDKTYRIKVQLAVRPMDLLNDTDVLTIPSRPVELLAYAKAVEERGEDGGINPVSAYAMAQKSLSDAIAFDAAKHPEETIWYES